jgi:Flp pilus assembly protein TadD
MTGAPDARASQERDRPTTAAAGTLEGTSARATEPEAKVAEATPTPAAPSASPTPSATEAAAAPAAPATDDTAAQVPDPAPAPDPAAAREAKRQAQHAIDRNQLAVAIEAGERSVALDPTDAEAWLILGAAYQSKGGYAEARRCFSSCMHEATRGPRSECGALLR